MVWLNVDDDPHGDLCTGRVIDADIGGGSGVTHVFPGGLVRGQIYEYLTCEGQVVEAASDDEASGSVTAALAGRSGVPSCVFDRVVLE